MRIAYFTETFLPNIDPITTKIRYLLDYTDAQGHDSIIFSPRYRGMPVWYKRTKVYPVGAIPITLPSGLRIGSPMAYVLGDLKMFRPDIIHLINPTFLGAAGLRAAKKLNIPVVASYHSDAPGFTARNAKGLFSRPLYNYYRRIHNQCDLTLAPSRDAQREMEMNGYERVAVWRAGVDVKKFSPEKHSTAWRQRLTAGNPNSPLVVVVSRMSRNENLQIIVDLYKALPNLRFAVVGAGTALNKLKTTLADTPTVFTGYLPEADLAEVYATGDALLNIGIKPSPNSTVDAMATGLPVIAPRMLSFPDLIQDGVSGLLFEPHDVDSLIAAIRRLVQDTSLGWQIGLMGRQFAEGRSWDVTLNHLIEEYEKVLSARQPQPEPSPPVAIGGVPTQRLADLFPEEDSTEDIPSPEPTEETN